MSSPVQYSDFSSSSYVWEYFLKSNDGLTAKCKLCSIILKTTARSTKGLHVHLKSRHHYIEDISKKRPENAASSSSASNRSSSRVLSPESQTNPTSKRTKITDHFPIQNSANSMEERVARMTAKDGLPFSVFVTSEDLRDLFQAKGYLLPRSSTSIRMMVMNYGTTVRMKVLHELLQLKQSEHRFSLTFDEWTSTGNRRYLNINVHTCSNNRALFWNLGLTRIFGSMPATVCVENLKKKMVEFDLDLDKDIVAITTDGASVMVKTGSLIPAYQQLCYAHGLQLGILDVIYKNKEQSAHDPLENSEADINNDEDRSNITEKFEDGRFTVEVSSEMEGELKSDFNDIINRVRKIVRIFKGSPAKNDVLQGYVKNEFGRRIELDRDCKTRWSSLATMLEKFNKLKLCIAKALIDLGLCTNMEYRFLEHDFDALVNLENTLKPVKLAVEVLCRHDANFITAEATLKFMIKKIEDNHSTLASELTLSLRQRILQRRTNMTALLIYLQNPRSYHASSDDETFYLPPKSLLRKEIKNFVIRMNFSLLNSSESNDDDEADQVRNVNEKVPSSGSDLDLTLQEELELTISSACTVLCPSPSRANTLESIIKKEMALYESGGSIGKYLTFTYKALKGIPPTSVEAERAFSAAGYIASKIRSSLADDTLDMLCFLRKHFQLKSDGQMTKLND